MNCPRAISRCLGLAISRFDRLELKRDIHIDCFAQSAPPTVSVRPQTVLGKAVNKVKLLLCVCTKPFAAVRLCPFGVDGVSRGRDIQVLAYLPVDPKTRQNGCNDFGRRTAMSDGEETVRLGLHD